MTYSENRYSKSYKLAERVLTSSLRLPNPAMLRQTECFSFPMLNVSHTQRLYATRVLLALAVWRMSRLGPVVHLQTPATFVMCGR